MSGADASGRRAPGPADTLGVGMAARTEYTAARITYDSAREFDANPRPVR